MPENRDDQTDLGDRPYPDEDATSARARQRKTADLAGGKEQVDDDATSERARAPEMPSAPDDLEYPYEEARPRTWSYVTKIKTKQEGPEGVKRRESRGRVVLKQGDVLKDVIHVTDVFPEDGPEVNVLMIRFPYVIVLTQACDLEHAKVLLSVLVAPMYNVHHFFSGEHLESAGFKNAPIDRNSTEGKTILNNKNVRYHYMVTPKGVEMPAVVIDFRNYFSVSLDYLRSIRRDNRLWTIPLLWRDDISQRFAAFLSRIGLPAKTPPADAQTLAKLLLAQ